MSRRARSPALPRIVVGLAMLAVFAALGPALRHVRAAALLFAVVGQDDASGVTAAVRRAVVVEDERLDLGSRTLRSRSYRPATGRARSLALVLHGVHPDGIEEPRLRAFARGLAEIGVEAHTPELPELARYRIEPRTIDDIAACATTLRRTRGRAPGAFGISFAGGLALIAAARNPSALDYVVTVGAHHDLRRLARYYADEPIAGPDGRRHQGNPHPYGARVMITAYAELFFSPTDVAIAREALDLWLHERYAAARALRPQLSAEGRARFDAVLDPNDRGPVRALLLQAARERSESLLAVSPANKLHALRTPAFLLHGADDPIIPSVETLWLARELPAVALARVLVTRALRHAEGADDARGEEQLALVRFVVAILEAAED